MSCRRTRDYFSKEECLKDAGIINIPYILEELKLPFSDYELSDYLEFGDENIMGYIMELRKNVGHRTLLTPCARAIIGDSKGNVLLQLRADNNTWATHGGTSNWMNVSRMQ